MSALKAFARDLQGADIGVQVGMWCTCGRRVQGTQKISNKDCTDDAALREAVLSAESKAKAQLENHVQSEAS